MNSGTRDSTEEYGQRNFPELVEYLKPRNFFGLLWGFVGGWFVTRDYRRFFIGLPFLLFTAAGAITLWALYEEPVDQMVSRYERAAVLAVRDGRQEEADLLLTQLTRIRPDDERVRMQLMLHLVEQGKPDQAAVHLRALTPPDQEGYVHARLWLVDQANRDSPAFPLTTEQKLAQLQRAVKEDPHNPVAHQLLAATYIERNELRLAEQHLLNSVDQQPSLGLLLYQLQGNLKRHNEDSRDYLRKAVNAFRQRALDAPQNAEVRINWAQALALLNNMKEAESVLTEGIKSSNEPAKLRSALAGLYLGEARRRLQQSPLNSNIAAAAVKQAATVDPGNAAVAQMCIALAGTGAQFAPDDLQPVIEYLRSRLAEETSELKDRIMLGQLLEAVGNDGEAVALLEPHADESQSIQTLLVRLYRSQGDQEKTQAMIERLLSQSKSLLDENPEDPQALVAYASALSTAQRFAEAVELIDQLLERIGKTRAELALPIKRLYVQQCLAAFEFARQEDPHADAFHYLEQAIDTRHVDFAFLNRIAQLSLSDDKLAEPASAMLTKLLSQGVSNAQIYQLIGTQALIAERYDQAAKFLRRAHSLAPNDPAILNNYAVSLIRASQNNAEQALSLCAQALEKLPDHPDVLSTRAEINVARSRWEDARRDLEMALPHRPDSGNLRKLLVQVYTEIGEDDLADEHQKFLDKLEAAEFADDS